MIFGVLPLVVQAPAASTVVADPAQAGGAAPPTGTGRVCSSTGVSAMVAAPSPAAPYTADAHPAHDFFAPPCGPQFDPVPAHTELTEIILLPGAPPRQASLRHENPLCRLARHTAACGAACENGCGIVDPLAVAFHTCPLGLEMWRVGPGPQGGMLWAGRRFTSAAALHRALDQLSLRGVDEATLLAHLPPNPIVFPQELAAGIAELRRDAAVQNVQHHDSPGRDSGPAAVEPQLSDGQTGSEQLGNLLEFFSQVHALLLTAPSREGLCDRFLHTVAGLVPYGRLEVFLPDTVGEGLVIAATSQRTSDEQLHPQVCRLASGDLGLDAYHRQIVLAHSADLTTQFTPNCTQSEPPPMLALPLLAGKGRPVGVWIATRPLQGGSMALGEEWFRAMTLLSRLLAGALLQVKSPADLPLPGGADAKPAPAPADQSAFGSALVAHSPEEIPYDPLAREVARAARQGVPLVLAHVALRHAGQASRERPDTAALELLGGVLGAQLRPFDYVLPLPAQPDAWAWEVLLSGADEATAQHISERLMMTLADALDARGGMEECGLIASVGLAVWGPAAPDAAALRIQALAAATAALALGQTGAIEFATPELVEQYLKAQPGPAAEASASAPDEARPRGRRRARRIQASPQETLDYDSEFQQEYEF